LKIPLGYSPAIGRAFIDLTAEITTAVMQTVKAGWDKACLRDDVHSGAGEVPMTECLRDGMREALVRKELPWSKTMVVLPGTESRSAPDVLTPDGRTDIPLFFLPVFDELLDHDPHAIIECKRVAENDSDLSRKYVTEGIDRFCVGKYSANHSKGFMAAYVIAGTASGAVGSINGYLEKLQDSSPVVVEWVRVSSHPRKDADNIELHHAVLLVA
jgi:hypothetical protein